MAIYTGTIPCQTCGQDYEVFGAEEDWTPPGFALCEHADEHGNACFKEMCLKCESRCEFCGEPRCAEHLTKTDCGMLCAGCKKELEIK